MAKFCSSCGAALGEGARFCTSCGQAVAGSAPSAAPVAAAPQAQPPPPAARSGGPSFVGRIVWWLVAFGIAYVAWTVFYQVFGEI